MRLLWGLCIAALLFLVVDAEVAILRPHVESGYSSQQSAAQGADQQAGESGIFGEWVSGSLVARPFRWLIGIDWKPEAITAAATVVLALLTFVLAFATLFLWRSTQQLVLSAEDTARRQLRAYVHVDGGKILDLFDPIKRRAVVVIKNYGQTPAYDHTASISTIFREFPLTSVLPLPPDDLRLGKEALPPGRHSEFVIPIGPFTPWGERQIIAEQQLAVGTVAIYVYGEIRYRDAFNSTWRTRYRLICQGEGLARGGLAADEQGNDET